MLGPVAVVVLLVAGGSYVTSMFSRAVAQTGLEAKSRQLMQVQMDALRIAKAAVVQAATPAMPTVLQLPQFAVSAAAPAGGGALPALPGPSLDPWGTGYGYCPAAFDPLVNVGNRVSVGGTPGAAAIALAVVSAGPDRSFQTSCASALAGTGQGDDQAVVFTHGDLFRLYYALKAGLAGATLAQATSYCNAQAKQYLPYASGADPHGCK